jgi:gas vesicle protein
MVFELLELVSRASQSDEFFREVPQLVAAMREHERRVKEGVDEAFNELRQVASVMKAASNLWRHVAGVLEQLAKAISELQQSVVDATKTNATAVNATAVQIKDAINQMQDAFTIHSLRRVEEQAVGKLDGIATQLHGGLTGISDVARAAAGDSAGRLTALGTEMRNTRQQIAEALSFVRVGLSIGLLLIVVCTGGIAWICSIEQRGTDCWEYAGWHYPRNRLTLANRRWDPGST